MDVMSEPGLNLTALGRRITVVGGGGKTTLASCISKALEIPHLELDGLFWRPNWVESATDEFRARVDAALSQASGGWVCDGNYFGKLGDLVVGQASTVIFVNMPFHVMWTRVLLRGIARAADQRQICGDNRETWGKLLSTDSLWWWHLKHRRKYLDRARRVREVTPTGTPLIELRSPRQLDQLYVRLGLTR